MKMNVITATTIRRLVDVANNYAIQKDDIVDIKKVGDEYILIYYTNEEN